MKQYETFIFDSYAFHPEEGVIELKYGLDDDLEFTETIKIPMEDKAQGTSKQLNELLFRLHLIGGISYFKTCLPKKIEIRSGSLSESEAAFWTKVYESGLGEFFYKNKIDYRGVVNFPVGEVQGTSDKVQAKESGFSSKQVLVPFGGGKDSLVTTELLKKAGYGVTLFRVGHHPIIDLLAEKAKASLLTIDRRLDAQLFKLNADGALNGHVPITAYLSILSVVVAELLGFDAAIWSNEASASEGNTKLHELEVNHQWSKGLEFEKDLRALLAPLTAVDYFSLLRPWSELKIVEEFCKFPQYFKLFTSCNQNWKILSKTQDEKLNTQGKWCGQCPKCAFAFALFAGFLPKEKLEGIFGKNLFADASLETMYRELLGLEGVKPFECVGTPEEVQAAFLLAHKRGDLEDTPVMQLFVKECLPKIKDPEALIADTLKASDHCIPKEFSSLVA